MSNANITSNINKNPSEILSRQHLLDVSSKMIKEILSRIKSKRFRPTEGDSIKLQYLRVLVSAIQAHNSILKDTELDDIKKRLENLEVTLNDNCST
ncbi:hypothetical protein [Methanolobus halotolerans]|uniref:DUF8136 domain-containing protein n=1 Tax=Methanolobus halotolerans TaxID=2052935 RepID=A0A4E0PUN4_9EURY|nr:hypothetical protein [Methanolobus halotolerans]TGC07017.1 hypothetical protein CUN85_12035 [Methanolobus halotolerans]